MASALRDKSKDFALAIIKVCNTVKNAKHESVLTNQAASFRNKRGGQYP